MTDRQRGGQTERWTDGQMDRETESLTYRKRDGQTDRWTNRQIDKQTD